MHKRLFVLFFSLHITSRPLLKLSNGLMALRGQFIQLFPLQTCAAHTVRALVQPTNLCHLHQNNYREINAPFDRFHSDLI